MIKTLAAFLKMIRNDTGQTLREVEKRTGISNAYLSQLETGKIKNPSPSVLHKLALFYKVSYEELHELAGYPPISEKNENNDIKPKFRTRNTFDDLTEEEEEELTEYLQFLRSRRKKK